MSTIRAALAALITFLALAVATTAGAATPTPCADCDPSGQRGDGTKAYAFASFYCEPKSFTATVGRGSKVKRETTFTYTVTHVRTGTVIDSGIIVLAVGGPDQVTTQLVPADAGTVTVRFTSSVPFNHGDRDHPHRRTQVVNCECDTPATTTTTPAPTTTTPAPTTTTPGPTTTVTTTPTPSTTAVGTATSVARSTTKTPSPSTVPFELPATGANAAELAWIAGVLVSIGALMLLLARWGKRRQAQLHDEQRDAAFLRYYSGDGEGSGR